MPITKVPARVRTELARGAPTYAIRPLEWHRQAATDSKPEHWLATTILGHAYSVRPSGDTWVLYIERRNHATRDPLSVHRTEGIAKRAAAQHWRSLITLMLVPVHP